MLNAIQAGIFTPSTKQRLDELEETKSQLEVSILQEEMHKPLLTREQIAFFIYRFRKFDVTKREQRQRLIDSFVNAVYLYEDKIILTFNYKDGSKTITLAEVEGSVYPYSVQKFRLRSENRDQIFKNRWTVGGIEPVGNVEIWCFLPVFAIGISRFGISDFGISGCWRNSA